MTQKPNCLEEVSPNVFTLCKRRSAGAEGGMTGHAGHARASPYPPRCRASDCHCKSSGADSGKFGKRRVAFLPDSRDSSTHDRLVCDKKINLKYFSAVINSTSSVPKIPDSSHESEGNEVLQRIVSFDDVESGDEGFGVSGHRRRSDWDSRKCVRDRRRYRRKHYFIPVSGPEDKGESSRRAGGSREFFDSVTHAKICLGKNSRRCRRVVARDDDELLQKVLHLKLMDARWKAIPCESLIPSNEEDRERELSHFIKEWCTVKEKSELLYDGSQPFTDSKKFFGIGPDCYFEPYFLPPKPTYCVNRKVSGPIDPEDAYMKAPQNDDSSAPSEGENQDAQDRSDLGDRRGSKKESVIEISPPPEEPKSKKSDENADQEAKKYKEGKPALKQEIKYIEGAFNIFGNGNESMNDRPYFRITKTVTFEKDKGSSPESPAHQSPSPSKTLGIDSWMQTPDSESSNERNRDEYRSRKPGGAADDESFVETAKVCCECLQNLANSKLGGAKAQRPSSPNDKGTDPRFKKAADPTPMCPSLRDMTREKPGANLMPSRCDVMKFIAELFLEAIPKEMYARLIGKNESLPGKDEEFEMRIKSYNKGSEESCNIKTCRLRENKVGGRDMPMRMQQQQGKGEKQRSDCCPCLEDAGSKPQQDTCCSAFGGKSLNNSGRDDRSRKNDYQTYDCQIVMNGRKIFVKLNKSVEDLLLSGTIQDAIHGNLSEDDVCPGKGEEDSGFTPMSHMCPTVESVINATMKGGCTCMDRGRNAGNGPNRTDNNKSGHDPTSRARNPGDSRPDMDRNTYRPDSFDKKYQNERNVRPVVTSPAGTRDMERPRKMNYNEHTKNTNADNAKNLFWCNVEVKKKINENGRDFFESLQNPKTAKAYQNDLDVACGKKVSSYLKPDNYDSIKIDRKPRKVEYPLQVLADRSRKCSQENYRRNQRCFGQGETTTAAAAAAAAAATTNKKPDQSCHPLYWDAQYLKLCDRIFTKERDEPKTGKCDNFEASLRSSTNRCLLNSPHGIDKRVVVSPGSYNQCETFDDKTPLYLFKISDKKCEPQADGGRGYRDYTVASVTSVKLRTNPFDTGVGAITCRKCIETLKTCAKTIDKSWPSEKEYESGKFCKTDFRANMFEWTTWNQGEGKMKDGATISSSEDAMLPRKASAFAEAAQTRMNRSMSDMYTEACSPHDEPSYCFLEDEFGDDSGFVHAAGCEKAQMGAGSDNICESIARRRSSVSSLKNGDSSRGISFELKKFNVCGRWEDDTSVEIPDKEEKVEAKERPRVKGFEILIDRIPKESSPVEIRKSSPCNMTAEATQTSQIVYLTLLQGNEAKADEGTTMETTPSEETLTAKSEIPATESNTTVIVDDSKSISLEAVRSMERVLLNNGNYSHSVDSIELQGTEKEKKMIAGRRKLTFSKSWRWWKRRKEDREDPE